MQHHLYLSDTYLDETTTTPLATGQAEDGRPWVALTDNIFHPQGGGQPNDTGTLNGHPVRIRRHADLVLLEPHDTHHQPHTDGQPDTSARCNTNGQHDTDHPLATGWSDTNDPLGSGGRPETGDARQSGNGRWAGFPTQGPMIARIDLETRKLHAALHTAGHLLDAYLGRHGFQHTGNSHFPGQARVDYNIGDHTVDRAALTEQLHTHFTHTIAAALKVTTQTHHGLRQVTIEDLDTQNCAGTHVTNLSALRDVSIRAIKVKAGLMKVGYTAAHI
ncbi:hypothetical protein [Streptacidiphilus cavernicola]|uniref:Threonyl/alanyl tRNA synthetase SAD domain-containing protein n=1 Tax=Streptacidiphilus cavernicola TaxID=3342716 RepID=A0ABV6W616_9ACTN